MSDNLVPPPVDPGAQGPGIQRPDMPTAGGPSPAKSNGAGVAALVLGIIALVFSFIPFAGYFGMALAVVGVILGIVGLTVRGRTRGPAIAGTILSGLALVLAIIMAIVYAMAFSAAVKAVNDAGNAIVSSSTPSSSGESSAGKQLDVVYKVTSDAATAGSISYFTINNGQSGQEQATDAALPWTKQLTLKQNGLLDFNSMSLTAQAAQGATKITCTITVNGVVKSTQTSTGSFSVVTCSTDGK